MLELVRFVLATLVTTVRSRQRLVVENLLLRQQLQVALCSRRRPRPRARDKLFWLLVRRLHRDWRRHLLLVRPETVLGWHRRGWRLFWRWRSGPTLGRPRLNREVRSVIATMAGENPHWGTERIRGELLKLGIAVSARSIAATAPVDQPGHPARAGVPSSPTTPTPSGQLIFSWSRP